MTAPLTLRHDRQICRMLESSFVTSDYPPIILGLTGLRGRLVFFQSSADTEAILAMKPYDSTSFGPECQEPGDWIGEVIAISQGETCYHDEMLEALQPARVASWEARSLIIRLFA